MKTSGRWLLIFGGAIGLLVIIAIVLVLTMTGGKNQTLLPEGTPEGTVQRFFLALKAEDYTGAYGYFSSDIQNKTSFDSWGSYYSTGQNRPNWQVTLGKPSVNSDEATIVVTIDVFRAGGPLENPINTHTNTFHLKKQDSSWKITTLFSLWQLYY